LARDVPAFDSVWIDALVHARKLTAFQAKVLESGRPERLAVGPCVLVDRLGHGASATYLARHRQNRERCVLKLIALPEEQRGPALESLRQLITKTEALAHPHLITPKSCLAHHEELVTVSQHVAGPSLSQLLVRRGRFPARIVLALTKQLIDGLAAMEDCGIIHGDLRLANLRLASSGRVVMVDAGINPAIRPELTIHARISPEHYDGIAPELIGTGNPADVRSEFYALGCLLWQLLAGRPPFPTGDPLAKLMAHQTRRVPDVRDIAPDTPPELAGIIKTFTDPVPNHRPHSFRAFRSRWGGPKRSHMRQTARFRALFNTAIPHIPAMTPEASRGPWPIAAAMLFLLSGATLCLMDAGAYTRLLSIPNQIQAYLNEPPTEVEPETSQANSDGEAGQDALKPLPAPDANGVIELPDAGPYRASQIELQGQLTIRGPAEVGAEIMIDEADWTLTAADVLLDNLQVRRAKPAGTSKPLSPATRARARRA
jgi:serine/threonine protein kinase